MLSRIALAISLVCASSAVADMIQPDAKVCGEPNSSDTTCSYDTPPLFWPAPHRNAATSFSGPESQRDTTLLALDAGSPIFNSKASFAGTSTADITEPPAVQGASHRLTFDVANSLTNSLTAGGTTHRIDRPLDFVFEMGSDETLDWKPVFDQQSSDSVPVTAVPEFDQPRASELPEQEAWSELLSISLGGAIIVGLAALCDRRILP